MLAKGNTINPPIWLAVRTSLTHADTSTFNSTLNITVDGVTTSRISAAVQLG